jgi:outer membrane receptor protein involved in Fe transport
LAAALPAAAQERSDSGVDASESGAIVVTGSRIQRDGAEAPSPVTVVGEELFAQRASTNVADALNELPAFRPLVSPATQQAVGGNVGARVLDLRGLGGERTLVLLDGKRFVPSTQRGTVDINLIPTALVKRVEIVTGGASAAYGSDAVAGVVNFILDREFEGLRGTAQFGIAEEGDNEEYYGSLAYGASFADGRGHFMVSGEYAKNEGMGDCYVRDWCPREMQLPGGGPGYATTVRAGPAQLGWWGPDGLVSGGPAGGPFRGTTFNPDGTLRQFQYGEALSGGVTHILNLGGEDALYNGLLTGTLLIPEVERYTAYAHASYDLTDSITASLDASFGRVNGRVLGSPPRAAYNITRDNAFLPAGLANLMDASGVNSVGLWRAFQVEDNPYQHQGNAIDDTRNDTYRIVAALNGAFAEGWSWDAYYQYGRNEFRQDYRNNYVHSRGLLAVDAVQTGSGVQCRVNVDANPANNDPACAPLNPFGRGNVSEAATAYAFASGFQTADTDQHVVAANLQGNLLALPGGMLQMAAGGEFRSDAMAGDADPLSTTNAFWSFNGKAIEGEIEVLEGYVEAVAPLLTDTPGVNLLELNGAVRQTHYSRSSETTGDSSVDVTTWKLGAVYEPTTWLRLRGTRSRDIRAPNLSELFGPVNAGRTTVIDPANNGSQIQIVAFQGANPGLEPEVADTWTVGAVLTPFINFGRRLSVSVDYFDISIDGAIGSLGAQTIVNRCDSGATEFCSLVERDAGSRQLVSVQDVFLNINQQNNRGIDFELNYQTNEGPLGALDLRVLASRYLELSTTDSAGVVDRAGQTGYRPGTTTGVPDWTVAGTIRWDRGPLSAGLHGRYLSKGIYEVLFVGPQDEGYDIKLPNSVNDNRVDAAFTLDFNLSYDVTDAIEVFGVINNVLNSDPPAAASAQGGTNQAFFDPIGRFFKVGARIDLP